MNKEMILNTVISATLGGIVGGVVTYLTVKRAIEERTQREIDEVKKKYALLRKEDGDLTIFGKKEESEDTGIPVEVLEEAKRVIEGREYASPDSSFESVEIDPEDEIRLPSNVFKIVRSKEEDPEPYIREPHKPYLISVSEFIDEEDEYEKVTITFFEGDNTLMYVNETLMDNRDEMIGDHHLSMFGRWSEDENIVYVRNPNHAVDFEIVREEGEYAEIIQGVRHEDAKKTLLRMRDNDQ